jgi:hypothetical protein
VYWGGTWGGELGVAPPGLRWDCTGDKSDPELEYSEAPAGTGTSTGSALEKNPVNMARKTHKRH